MEQAKRLTTTPGNPGWSGLRSHALSLAAAAGLCSAVLGTALLTAATATKSFDKPLSKDQKIEHALNRLTFGARPGDVDDIKKLGLDKWIQQQLHPDRIAENPDLVAKLKQLTTLAMSSREMAERYDIPLDQVLALQAKGGDAKGAAKGADLAQAKQKAKQQLKQQGKGPQVPARELTEAKLLRAVYSERQLEEQLVDFWFNHFNVNIAKGADRMLVTSYERDAIRPYVLGKFRDMLGATAAHPAMLFYLDNWQNSAPLDPRVEQLLQNPNIRRRALERAEAKGNLSPEQAELLRQLDAKGKGKGKQANRGINENYARELLELHTLGVDNGYTQQDIVEVARCFTGWTIQQPRQGGDFLYRDAFHDQGDKTVLGVKIKNSGQQDGERVLDILAKRPETARFISFKLAQRFVADEPPEKLVARMAKEFQETDGDLRAVVETMITSPEFFSEGAWNAKMKMPLEFVASSLRATGATVQNALPLAQRLNDMGQPLYRKVEPTGYSSRAEEWTNSAALLARVNFALDLTSGKVNGTRIDNDSKVTGEMLGSPEFQRK